jgi:hypothetical protein
MKPILTVALAVLLYSHSHGQAWELVKDKNRIKVYTRKREHSPIKAFRVVSTFETPQENVLSVLLNMSSYAQWYDHCKIAETILNDQAAVTYYMEMSMPFPFDNRDAVYRLEITRGENSTTLIYRAVANVKTEIKRIVRLDYAVGSWTVSPINQNLTQVEHEFEGDPKGNIPASIANLFLVQGPLNTFERLKKYIASVK